MLVGFNGYLNTAGVSVPRFEYPGDVRLAAGGFFQDTAADALAANGMTQDGATELTAGLNNVTTLVVGSKEGVRLPATVVGRKVVVWNNAPAGELKVYPSTESSNNGGAMDAAALPAISAGQSRTFRAISATKWLTE